MDGFTYLRAMIDSRIIKGFTYILETILFSAFLACMIFPLIIKLFFESGKDK